MSDPENNQKLLEKAKTGLDTAIKRLEPSETEMDQQKRKFLKTAGATATIGLAGCSESYTSGGNVDKSNYDLSFTTNNVDLTDLDVTRLNESETIRDEDYFTLKYALKEEGQSVEPDDLTLEIETENGQYIPEADYSEGEIVMPCTEAATGENSFILKAEINGQEVAVANQKAEKTTPNTYKAQAVVDGQTITAWETPYQFDTFTDEGFDELRLESKKEAAYMNHLNMEERNIVEMTLEEDEIDFHPDHDLTGLMPYPTGEDKWVTESFRQLEDTEDILKYTNSFVRRFHAEAYDLPTSGHASELAATQEILIRKHHPEKFEEIRSYGVINGAHGTIAHYVEREGIPQHYHQETTRNELLEIQDINQASTIEKDDRTPFVLAEYTETGKIDRLNFLDTKLALLNSTLIDISRIGHAGRVQLTDSYGISTLDKIRANAEMDEFIKPIDIGGNIHVKTGKNALVYGTTEEPAIMVSESNHMDEMDDKGYENLQTREQVENHYFD